MVAFGPVLFSLRAGPSCGYLRLGARLSSPKSRGAVPFPLKTRNRRACSLCFSFVTLFRALTRRSLSPLFRKPGVLYTPSRHHHHIHSSALIGLCPQVQHINTHSLLSIAEYLHFRRPQSPDHITQHTPVDTPLSIIAAYHDRC